MKTHHGTIVMQYKKTSIGLVVVFLAFASLCYYEPGREYWEAVGPRWDRMFNPVNYND
jgi:hypothetical protein